MVGGIVIFSRKSDYGLRALIYLAEHQENGPTTLSEIAETLDIPKAFLSKILQQLCHGTVVKSLKGPNGGFVLAREPKELTVAEIVSVIDGPLCVFECFSPNDGSQCEHYGKCKILAVFDVVGKEIQSVLSRVTLENFIDENSADQLSKQLINK